MSDVYMAEEFTPTPDIEECLVYGYTYEHKDTSWHIGYHCKLKGWMVINNGDYIDGGYGKDYPANIAYWQPLPEPPK